MRGSGAAPPLAGPRCTLYALAGDAYSLPITQQGSTQYDHRIAG
jgi:hypothetical protein